MCAAVHLRSLGLIIGYVWDRGCFSGRRVHCCMTVSPFSSHSVGKRRRTECETVETECKIENRHDAVAGCSAGMYRPSQWGEATETSLAASAQPIWRQNPEWKSDNDFETLRWTHVQRGTWCRERGYGWAWWLSMGTLLFVHSSVASNVSNVGRPLHGS